MACTPYEVEQRPYISLLLRALGQSLQLFIRRSNVRTDASLTACETKACPSGASPSRHRKRRSASSSMLPPPLYKVFPAIENGK